MQPPGGKLVEGDRLVLGCSVAAGTGPLSFSWHRQGSATPLATGPRYELGAVRHRDGGFYHCTATNGGTAADSPPQRVTVLGERDPPAPSTPHPQHHLVPRRAAATGLTSTPSLRPAVPVAGAAIVTTRTEPSVPAGESLNLSCSVQAGTAPVTFTWLRDGQELGSGPVLSLGAVGPAHAGTYQCQATNRLGAHRVFRARSPALALSVTEPGWRQQGTGGGRARRPLPGVAAGSRPPGVGADPGSSPLCPQPWPRGSACPSCSCSVLPWAGTSGAGTAQVGGPQRGTGGRVGAPGWGESPPHG